MRNLDYQSIYKDFISNILVNNDKIIALINPIENEYLGIEDVLFGGTWYVKNNKLVDSTVKDRKEIFEIGHIFDYEFVNNKTDYTKTFILVECSISSVDSGMFNNYDLYIIPFCEKSLVRISNNTSPSITECKNMNFYGRNRIDMLCSEIEKAVSLAENVPALGKITPSKTDFMKLYVPNDKYYGKILHFNIRSYSEEYEVCDNGN